MKKLLFLLIIFIISNAAFSQYDKEIIKINNLIVSYDSIKPDYIDSICFQNNDEINSIDSGTVFRCYYYNNNIYKISKYCNDVIRQTSITQNMYFQDDLLLFINKSISMGSFKSYYGNGYFIYDKIIKMDTIYNKQYYSFIDNYSLKGDLISEAWTNMFWFKSKKVLDSVKNIEFIGRLVWKPFLRKARCGHLYYGFGLKFKVIKSNDSTLTDKHIWIGVCCPLLRRYHFFKKYHIKAAQHRECSIFYDQSQKKIKFWEREIEKNN